MFRFSRHLLLILALLIPGYASADWISGGMPIATPPYNVGSPQLVSDGEGGVIIVWATNSGSDYDIYAQRVDAHGNKLWAHGGIQLTIPAGVQWLPLVVSDGLGGAIVSWTDNDYAIVARIDANGATLWTATLGNGFWAGSRQYGILSDGAGGAFLCGQTTGGQHLEATGQPAWATVDFEARNPHHQNQMVTDGAGGMIFAWNDGRRSDPDPDPPRNTYVDIYAQRINAAGSFEWISGGMEIRRDAQEPALAAGANGSAAIIMDLGDWPNGTMVARRIAADGSPVWSNDVLVCSTPHDTYSYLIIPDGLNGFLVGWKDYRADADVYAQRLDPDGNTLWTANGVPVEVRPGSQGIQKMVSDGQAGFIAVTGESSGSSGVGNTRLHRINSGGVNAWGEDGVLLNGESSQWDAAIEPDGAGGVYCAWWDNRSGHAGIYLQRFNIGDGQWGSPVAVAITSFRATLQSGGVLLKASLQSNLRASAVNIYRGSDRETMRIIDSNALTSENHFTYVDRDLSPSTTYRYQIGVVDADGEFLSPVASVTTPDLQTTLEQNHPNPFNPTTTIRFTLPVAERATLAVFSQDGSLVRVLVDDMREAGTHLVEWDGRDSAGVNVSSGVYFYRLTAGKVSKAGKMVLVK